MTLHDKQSRTVAANQLINAIASCGRHFFTHNGFISSLELSEKGRVYFIDYYTRKRVYTHKEGDWIGFTSGGSLKWLVMCLRDFVTHGHQMDADYFSVELSNPWGYGEDIVLVRKSAVALGIAKYDDRWPVTRRLCA